MHEFQEPVKQVTELLAQWQAGDRLALEELLPFVYTELRHVARRQLRRERQGHTLQSAALVNEVYLRLIDQRPFGTENRMHFVAVASRLMRQVLVDHARSHGAAKRGAEQIVRLDASIILPQVEGADVIAVDDALKDLNRLDEQQGQIVEMRFFGGFSNEEIAQLLGISSSTVKRDWNVAKAWLARAIRKGNSGERGAVAEG